MEALLSHALKMVLGKDTVFLGLFLVGYYLQFKDRGDQKLFINKQQDVLIDLTDSVKDIAKSHEQMVRNQERADNRLDRIENKLFHSN
ncbi:hypothetical protein PSYJYH_000049 [Bacillus phage PSYJ-YH]|nr:hypothetical protein PSYJYH_000049 [Bacillus phage PSYJ-YH]